MKDSIPDYATTILASRLGINTTEHETIYVHNNKKMAVVNKIHFDLKTLKFASMFVQVPEYISTWMHAASA